MFLVYCGNVLDLKAAVLVDRKYFSTEVVYIIEYLDHSEPNLLRKL